jgi:[methyl-Co(III) methanol-specific corrinoid protein]:coenzyme M methyltransferase
MRLIPKERLLNVLLGKSVDRVPTFCSGCSQTVTVECMEAAGVYWPDGHRDSEKMARLSASVYELTGLEVAGAPYCLTVEAEILGCQILWSDEIDAIPQVFRTPYQTPIEIEIPSNFLALKRAPVLLNAVKILKQNVGSYLPIVAGITGPFSLAGHLVGIENLLKWVIRDPQNVQQAVDKACETGALFGKALREAGADIVLIADPSASSNLISPRTFKQFVKPAITRIVAAVGGITFLHICGNANPILTDMADTGVDAISIDENVDVGKAKALLSGKVKIAGNISTTNTLLLQKPEDVAKACLQVLEAGVDILAPGCGIAPRTPNVNIKALVEAAKQFRS